MKRIAFVIPYFGKMPDYFEFWLESVKANPSIDFLIFTDDETPYRYPENVKVEYLKFSRMKEIVQSRFDFNISLENPYKLCDYKLAYGYIFSDYLKKYDFWGHCDLDLLFGNIRSFFSDELLNNYDKLMSLGHCELYRNAPEINTCFMKDNAPYVSYRVVLSSPAIWAFDESTSPVNRALWNGVKQYTADLFVDLPPRFRNLVDTKRKKNCVFFLENGKLFEIFESSEREIMYVHFQSREILCRKSAGKAILLTPYGIGYTDCAKKECFLKESCVGGVWKYNLRPYCKKIKGFLGLLYFLLLRKYPKTRFLMWSRLSKETVWNKRNADK